MCVSSQIGCAENCQFCMTGKMGLVRNLTAAEILGQVFFARQTVRKHGMVSASLDCGDACIGRMVGRGVLSTKLRMTYSRSVFELTFRSDRTQAYLKISACPISLQISAFSLGARLSSTLSSLFLRRLATLFHVPPTATADKRSLHGDGRAAGQPGGGQTIAGPADTPVRVRDG